MHRIKSYGENKILSHNMAISFVFLPNFRPKITHPEEALPSGPQSSSLYFGISGGRRTGITWMLIQNSSFYFFCPPPLMDIAGMVDIDRSDMVNIQVMVKCRTW